MLTLKQLEALYWIGQLETFERAAARLHTTQSAISKRIGDLEAAVGVALFDRAGRSARMTEKGEQLLALAAEMLALQQRAEGIANQTTVATRRLRLGITELTALTWLPRFVAGLRDVYPDLIIETQVEHGRHLFDGLLEDRMDLIVVPEVFSDPAIRSVPLARIRNVWMASPSLVPANSPMTLAELSDYRIMLQSNSSGTGMWVTRWLQTHEAVMPFEVATDSLIALLGMTVAGLGVTYLPRDCFAPLIEEGKLVVIPTSPALPDIPYVAMMRQGRPDVFMAQVVEIARACCDFSRQLQEAS